MIYILIAESIAICFFLCRYLDALSKAQLRTAETKRLKTHLRAPKKEADSAEATKKIILLQNIENYGTDIPQEDI